MVKQQKVIKVGSLPQKNRQRRYFLPWVGENSWKQTAAGFSSDIERAGEGVLWASDGFPRGKPYWLFPPLTFLRSDFSVKQTSIFPNLVFQIANMFLSKFAKFICPICQMYLSLCWLWEKPKNCVFFHLNFSFVDRTTFDQHHQHKNCGFGCKLSWFLLVRFSPLKSELGNSLDSYQHFSASQLLATSLG